jgi:uncharacterized domain HDIG
MKNLPAKLRNYLLIIYALTITSLFIFVYNGVIVLNDIKYQYIPLFTILIALTETLTVPFKTASFSTSFAIHLASLILFGPAFTIIVVILGFSLRILKIGSKYQHILNTPIYGTFFNYCVLILPIVYGYFFYLSAGGYYPISYKLSGSGSILIFCFVFFIINTLLMSILLSIRMNQNVIYVFISNIRLAILNIIILAPFGILLAYILENYGPFGVFWVIFPAGLARYTFSLYIDSKNQYFQTVDTLMKAMEARDKYTEGHSQRVGDLAVKIAKELKYSDFKIEKLKIASVLHDVGKIGVDDSILNKPGMLTQEEYEKIKQHPKKGYEILNKVKNLEDVLPIVLHHHERYDGKGYPDGKKAEELKLEVFIVQLADSIDAMATDRPYRQALTKDVIVQEVRKNSGTQFHPKVVDAYLRLISKEN